MQAEQITHLIPYILSTFVSLGIGLYAWQHRRVTGASYYALVAFSQGLTSLAYIFEISNDLLQVKTFWDDVQWLTLSVATVSLLVFALHYSVRPPSRPLRQWVYLATFPLLFMILVLTNRWHGFTRSDARVVPGELFSALQYSLGRLPAFFSAYLLLLGFTALGVLIWRYFQVGRLYRAQLMTVILGVAPPALGGLATVLGFTLTFQRDLSPITFALGNLIVAWGLVRYRLLDVAPIAREVVIENMSDAVLVLDLLGRIVDINPAGRLLFGRLNYPAPFTGRSVTRVLEHWPELVEQDREGFEPLVMELAFKTPAGEMLTFSTSISPIHASDKTLSGRVVLLREITERKSMEEELIMARDRAEKSDRLKSQFLASVSHELRTPLNAIINFNQFVSSGLHGPVNEQQRDSLVKSTDSARHLLALINDVLDMSKIETGHSIDLFFEDNVDIAAEVYEVATICRALLDDKPVELVLEIADDLPKLAVDRRRIRQILLNLTANAAKFTDTGIIRLGAWSDGEQLNITVTDTGPGISAAEQSLVFEPFYQVEPVYSAKSSGTGLGLPISRRLAEAHGGNLWLESRPGQGSSFFLAIPLDGASQFSTKTL